MRIYWGDSTSGSPNDSHTYENSGSFMVSVFLQLYVEDKNDDLPTGIPMDNRLIIESKIKRKWAQEEYNEWFYNKLKDAAHLELALSAVTGRTPCFQILIDEVILEDLESENTE